MVAMSVRAGRASVSLSQILVWLHHSHMWNEFLVTDPYCGWPVLCGVMALTFGGNRWIEMLFHDVHDGCFGRIGVWSQLVLDDDAEILTDALITSSADFAGFPTWFDVFHAHPDVTAIPNPKSMTELLWRPEVT